MFFILYKEFHRLFGLYTHLLMINYELGGLVVAKGGRGNFLLWTAQFFLKVEPPQDPTVPNAAWLRWSDKHWRIQQEITDVMLNMPSSSDHHSRAQTLWFGYLKNTANRQDITVLRGPCNTSNSVEWVQCCSIDVLFTDKFLKKTNKRDINECNAYFSRSPSAQLLTFPLSWGCADSNDLPSLPFVLLSLVHLCYQYGMCVMLIWLR